MRRALAFTAIVVAASASARVAEAQVRVATFEKPAVALDLYGWVSPRVTIAPVTPFGDPDVDVQFSVPQARFGAVATLGRWATMHTEIDLAPVAGAVPAPPWLLDAYAVVTPHRSRFFGIDVTLGRFRVPISRQNLIQPIGLQTPELAGAISAMIPGRQLGGMLGVDFLERKIRLLAGVYNGGWGTSFPLGAPFNLTFEVDKPWLLYAGRIELQPLGPAPSFEGDLRPTSQRRKPVLSIGASGLRTKVSYRYQEPPQGGGSTTLAGDSEGLAAGADVGFWYAGASFYGEILYRVQDGNPPPGAQGSEPDDIRWLVTSAQLGYFLPFGLLREHVELVARAQYRDIDLLGAGYAIGGGVNGFFDRGHRLKAQLFYDVGFEGARVMLQATAGF
ncbi:hypothetical protein [Polyangium jinanense]|uniref:Bacterial surface antigen (D15) domain-containing protein n=1 Tax=Polyangium jinanense TaxID=2829994 RepID=A0A9X3X4G5_9BACT|nr:hypothetical protein [Polyangium jinanense]MDC3954979.1 hypothetical protein [Polyangium jinanense]MDC3981251.1 hypothetical protein [Polyangium jinanense]